ncbi:MAG TPA: S-layer homology domain-containing protein [Symbiobacteriaceae bacterium]|nr:S-layer homology domain-containing protein [Symbiobacteriaceae bacterium]
MSSLARSKPKWWSSLLVLVIFCLSLVQPALAAGPTANSDLVNLLRQYNIVRGDTSGDLQLGKPLTRAEMAVILVRITGKESEVENLKGLGLFTDTKGHWADGYVTSARMNGLMKGFEDGSFHPQDPVTYAQAFTLVLRLVGREPDPKNWPTSALMDAIELKVVPPGFTGISMINEPALRGEIFTSLGLALTTVKTAEGQTYFQKWIDSTAPELTVSGATTNDATYQLRGTARDAARVLVNGEAATLNGQSFTKTVSLTAGANRFTVEAFDLAGNKATQQVTITRGSAAASLTIEGPEQVALGSTAAFTITALNVAGDEVPATGVTARVTGSIGTFDVATGTFRAGTTAGTGKIEVTLGSLKASADVQVLGTSENAAELSITATPVAYTKPMTVTVKVLDANGNPVADDFGRVVTLTASGVMGLSVTPQEAKTANGVATFTVRGGAAGNVTLVASSDDLAGDTATATFSTTTRVVLVTDSARIPTTGTLLPRIRAELRDENGNLVVNKNGDIYVDLAIDGPGTLVNGRVRIANGASTSAQTNSDGQIAPTAQAGNIVVSGTINGTQKYTVENLTVVSFIPTVGAGTKFRVVPLRSHADIKDGEVAEFMVQVVDATGAPVVASDYAFQVEVSTSNNEPKEKGVPAGMTVFMGENEALNPVSDGKADGSDIIARTESGNAVVKVKYNKPGNVTLKVVAAGNSSEAYNSDGEAGDAVASSAAWVTTDSTGEVTFDVTPNTIKLTAKSDLYGDDAPALNNKAGSSRSYTLTAYVAYTSPSYDDPDARYWVPGEIRRLDLYKNDVKVANGEARDGKATFTITASGTADVEDVYQVKDPAITGTLAPSNDLWVRTDGKAPDAAGAPIIRGVPSYNTGEVLATDDGMELSLPTDAAQRYVIVKVYTDTNSNIYTSGPVDVSSGAPSIVVPKDKLTAGTKSFYVKYKNAYGEATEKGALSNPVTVYTLSTTVGITSAKYDAVNEVLYISGRGFTKDDIINSGELWLRDPMIIDSDPEDDIDDTTANLYGAVLKDGVTVTSSSIALDLSGIAPSEREKIATFGGAVKLSANTGWIVKANGQMGDEDLDNAVGPMAVITQASYEQATHILYIYGRGFKTGTLVKTAVHVGTQTLNSTGMTVNVRSDSEIWVTLNATAQGEVEGNANLDVTADDGWFVDSTTKAVGKMAAQSTNGIYGYVRVTSVSYNLTSGEITITGQGFKDGTVPSNGKVKIVDEYRTDTVHEIFVDFVKVSTDGRSVVFKFKTDADKAEFKDNFKRKVFLVAEDGWFQVPVGNATRDAAGIPDRTLKFNK